MDLVQWYVVLYIVVCYTYRRVQKVELTYKIVVLHIKIYDQIWYAKRFFVSCTKFCSGITSNPIFDTKNDISDE